MGIIVERKGVVEPRVEISRHRIEEENGLLKSSVRFKIMFPRRCFLKNKIETTVYDCELIFKCDYNFSEEEIKTFIEDAWTELYFKLLEIKKRKGVKIYYKDAEILAKILKDKIEIVGAKRDYVECSLEAVNTTV